MAHVGSMICPAPKCGQPAAVSVSTTGNRSVRCPFCGFSGHAGPGSKAARLLDAATIPAEPDEAPKGDSAAAPAPAAAPRRAATLMG
jgi:hypothetical protein